MEGTYERSRSVLYIKEFVSHDFSMKLEQIHQMDCLMEMLRMRTSTTDEWPINIAEVSRILTSYANVTRITIESNSVSTNDYNFHETFTLQSLPRFIHTG